jgi:hypothetical protein
VVSAVATPVTEKRWIREARSSSRRELESKVKRTRREAKAARGAGRNQGSLGWAGDEGAGSGGGEGRAPRVEVPVHLDLRLTPEQYARYEALMEALRKRGKRQSREEIVLAGLEAVVGEDLGDPNCTRVQTGPRHQVFVQQCDRCGAGAVVTSRGPKAVPPAELGAILCDAKVARRGERSRSVIPSSVRRAVLERDGHRCRAAGCRSSRFLSVHHVVPREAGGSNDVENLITLCSGCHRVAHEHGERPIPIARNA